MSCETDIPVTVCNSHDELCMIIILLQVLKQAIQSQEIGTGRLYETAPLFGDNVECMYSVSAVADYLEFSPAKWEDEEGDWKVLAKSTPKVTGRQ